MILTLKYISQSCTQVSKNTEIPEAIPQNSDSLCLAITYFKSPRHIHNAYLICSTTFLIFSFKAQF